MKHRPLWITIAGSYIGDFRAPARSTVQATNIDLTHYKSATCEFLYLDYPTPISYLCNSKGLAEIASFFSLTDE
jgi:hypothetical protein